MIFLVRQILTDKTLYSFLTISTADFQSDSTLETDFLDFFAKLVTKEFGIDNFIYKKRLDFPAF